MHKSVATLLSYCLSVLFSRRKVEDVTFLTWEESLSRDDVDAFIICTENDTHEEYARSGYSLARPVHHASKHHAVTHPTQ